MDDVPSICSRKSGDDIEAFQALSVDSLSKRVITATFGAVFEASFV
jgi:hypothetical protein